MARILLLCLTIALVSCSQVKVTNGEIPRAHFDAAQALVGAYRGEFAGSAGTLDIALLPGQSGHRLVVRFSGNAHDDLLGPSCRSRIGDLTALSTQDVDGRKYIERARFAFDANACADAIAGRDIALNVRVTAQNIQLRLALLQSFTFNHRCRREPPPPVSSGRTVCDQPVAEYLSGVFERERG